MSRLRLAPILPPGDVCHVATSVLSRRQAGSPHDHDFFEIFLIVEGGGVHQINGHDIALEVGHLVLIRPADKHDFRVAGADKLAQTNVAFSQAWFDSLCRLWPRPPTVKEWRQTKLPPSILLKGEAMDSMQRILQELHRAPVPRHLELARFCLEALRFLDARLRRAERPRGPAWLEDCVAEMDQPALLAQDIGYFQGRAGRSAAHLARMSRRYFGVPPTELLNRARIRHAQGLLLRTDAKVIDIAGDCGFQNLGYFYRTFRRLSRMSPRSWRRRHAVPLRESRSGLG